MRSFFGLLWHVYSELLKLVGNVVLVLAGISACAWATIRQYEPVHSTQENTLIFIVGITLVISSWVRRFIWTSFGLVIPWLLLVAAALYLLVHDPARFDFSPAILLIAFAPPIFVAFLLELLPKPPAGEGKETLLPSPENQAREGSAR